ncbi:MAG: beta-ketoacyl synthase [Agarilytica sp.]
MNSRLPLIVGFGGYNAAGRSSGHLGYKRTIFESLKSEEKQSTVSALASIMGLEPGDETGVLAGTLIRKIESNHFDCERAPITKRYKLELSPDGAASFTTSRRSLPEILPEGWHVEPLDEGGKRVQVTISAEQDVRVEAQEPMPVKSAGQLPSGFNPEEYYRSLHHPRGIQMAVLGASDAVKSMGLGWRDVVEQLPPDQVSVYSASLMCQLDNQGFGGLFRGRLNGERTSSKQVALGFNSMPADFINAYVLGSMGATAASAGACATFLYNLRQAVEDIRSGRRQVSVVGASEAPILPEIIDGYGAMGALATDANLQKLTGASEVDHRRASRPFGDNIGFTLAESTQYVVLMSDELAHELGAKVYGAVPSVYVNADGYKKSISAPGAGNYITVAKAMGLAKTLLGDEALRQGSFMQAHGSSTPQNRITESKIFDVAAKAFNIEQWPVAAVKAYVGHALGAASGDQLASTLGVFEHGYLPGIKTIDRVADDVFADRLSITSTDQYLEEKQRQVAFINSKGFGGNNATAAVFSPQVAEGYMQRKYGNDAHKNYLKKQQDTQGRIDAYLAEADQGKLDPIYEFGRNLLDEDSIEMTSDSMQIPGYGKCIKLDIDEGFDGF